MEYLLRLLGREQCSRPFLDQQSPIEPTASSIMGMSLQYWTPRASLFLAAIDPDYLIDSSLTCPRTDTVEELARLLNEERVVHV